MDNVSSDEFQEAAVAYAKENPFSKKVEPVNCKITSKVIMIPHNTLCYIKGVKRDFYVRGFDWIFLYIFQKNE